MHYLTQHWSVDPFLFVVLVLAAWHEIGLARGAASRLRSLWFYAGLVVALIAVDSPMEYWSERYFFVHMLQHLLLMFAAPSLVVAGAPGQPLLDALPGRSGKTMTRSVLRLMALPPLRGAVLHRRLVCWADDSRGRLAAKPLRLDFTLVLIFSENRFPLFGIMQPGNYAGAAM